MINLQEKIKNLPSSPGVYLMKDSTGSVIYVGKAKNLKRRVQSYFQNSKNHSQKTKQLVHHLKDFEVILTDTEFEAFMLECSLIQNIKPHYNRKMKNPKAYTYIVIKGGKSDYRKIELSTSVPQNNNHLCFGPYTSKSTVERAVQALKEFYKISCGHPKTRNSACLNYSLGLCMGMCLGGTAIEMYNSILDQIIGTLEGTNQTILEDLHTKMIRASEQADFENAAKYRDTIDLLRYLINKEKVIEFTEENKNIAVIEYLTDSTFKLFLIKGNEVLFSEKYVLKPEEKWNESITDTIRNRILSTFKTSPSQSAIKVSKEEIDEAQIIYSYLKSSNCRTFTIPNGWFDCDKDDKLTKEVKQILKPLC